MWSSRHHQFLTVLKRVLHTTLRSLMITLTVSQEPVLYNIPGWSARPGFEGGVVAPRGDLAVAIENDRVLVGDVMITHPVVRAPATQAATTAGHAAKLAFDFKTQYYNARHNFPKGTFFPIAVETGGRMHPETHKFLALLVRLSVTGTLDPDVKMEADQKRAYAAKLRFVITATSAQLARSTAAAIYCLANACKVAAVSDPVVMQPAPAPVAGAVEGADE
jgi:hypothetical protein